MVGRFMECHCNLRNIQDLLSDGKTPYGRRFGIPFNRPVIPFGAMVEYQLISAKDQSRLHQFGAKVLPGIFLGYVLYAGKIWKGDMMVADIEEMEEMDAYELHARRRDEWNHLIHSCNISHFSSTCCVKNSSLLSCSTMTKRIQEQKEEGRVVSKSRPAAMHLSFPIATSSASASSPIGCRSLGMPTASGKPDSRMGNSNAFDAASTSQVRLQDAYIGGSMGKQRGNPSHQEEEDSKDSNNNEIWYYNKLRREPLPKTVKLGSNPLHTEPVLQLIRKVKKDTEATWRHYFQISPHTSQYTEAVLSMIRRICGRQPGDLVKDWDVNAAIWRMFMNATLQAAVYLGQDYDANLRYVKNTLWKTAGQLVRETEKLVRAQTETSGISTIVFQDSEWMSTGLLHS